MAAALFKIIILLLCGITVFGQEEHLPQRAECGTLKKEYYYNQKNLAEISEFPWMGTVQYINNTETWFQCFTVLISKRFSLLNNKCFQLRVQPARVLFGDWNKGNDESKSDCDDSGRCAPVPKFYNIEESIRHPNYSLETGMNDIALIKLSEPITYSDFIQPICLPSKDVEALNFDNQLLEVTGWYLNNSLGQILGKSFARVVNLNTCALRLEAIYKVHKENTICASTCWDNFVYASGAALMGTVLADEEPSNYYIIGLNVYGQAECSPRNPHAYTRIDRYLDWIYENTKYESSLITPRIANS